VSTKNYAVVVEVADTLWLKAGVAEWVMPHSQETGCSIWFESYLRHYTKTKTKKQKEK